MKHVSLVLLCKAASRVAAPAHSKLPEAGWQEGTTPLQPSVKDQDYVRTCLNREKKEIQILALQISEEFENVNTKGLGHN